MNLFNKMLVGFTLLATPAAAQTLQVSQSQLNFGNTYENAPATLPLTFTNTLGYDVEVTNIRFFDIYNKPAFSIDDTAFTVQNGQTAVVNVTFSPLHNIQHNSEMVVETNAHGGNLSVDLVGQGKYSLTYYSSTENQSEEQLKQALKTTISAGYTSLGYNNGRDKMYEIIDNQKLNGRGATVNTIECIYTGRVVTGYNGRSDLFNTHSINAEHTFPQGKFNSAEPMKSDIHHLFPSDEQANGSRGNQPFGIATTPYRNDHINAPSHLGANSLYEPRDVQKGPSARAMMYFVIRYQDYQNFFAPQEAILKTWNSTFAPTAVEVKRNDDVQTFQHNRNPFSDYPQFADRISSFVSNSVAPSVYQLYKGDQVNFGRLAPNTTYTFNYVLVNHGNQPIQILNKNLSSASLSFGNNTNTNATIAPGEAHVIQIDANLPNGDSIAESLTFNTSLPGSAGSVTVPVYANRLSSGPLSTGSTLSTVPGFNIYPNPVQNELVVKMNEPLTGNSSYTLTNSLGQVLKQGNIKTDLAQLNVEELPRGVYILQVQNGQKVSAQRFVKIN